MKKVKNKEYNIKNKMHIVITYEIKKNDLLSINHALKAYFLKGKFYSLLSSLVVLAFL
jgi:hypothetical protein